MRIFELKDSSSLQDRAFSAIWPHISRKTYLIFVKMYLWDIFGTKKSPLNFGSHSNLYPDFGSGSGSGLRIIKAPHPPWRNSALSSVFVNMGASRIFFRGGQ